MGNSQPGEHYENPEEGTYEEGTYVCMICHKNKTFEELHYWDNRKECEWYNKYPCHLCRDCQPEYKRKNSNYRKQKKSIDVCEICDATSRAVKSDKWNDEQAHQYTMRYPKNEKNWEEIFLCYECQNHWHYTK